MAAFFSVPTLSLKDVQLWGGGNSAIGAGFSGKAGIYVASLTLGTNFRFDNVDLHGWGAATSGFQGVNVGEGVSTGISNGWFTNFNEEAFGEISLVLDPGFSASTSGQLFMAQSYVADCVQCVDLKSGVLSSSNDIFGFSSGSGDIFTVESGALFNSSNDTWSWSSPSGWSQLTTSGVTNLTNAYIYTPTSGSYALAVKNGTTNISQSTIYSPTKGNSLYVASGAAVNDNGGNLIGLLNGSGFQESYLESTVPGTSNISQAISTANYLCPSGWLEYSVFTGVQSTALSSFNSPCGTTYTLYSSDGASPSPTMPVLSGANSAILTTGTNGDVNSTASIASANVTADVDCTLWSGFGCAAWVRASGGANTRYYYSCSLTECDLYSVVAGSAVQLGSTSSHSWTAGTTHRMVLSAQSTTITANVDGATIIGPITNSAVAAAGLAGFRVAPGGSVAFFGVTSP